MKQAIARSLIVVSVVFLVIAGKFAYIQLVQADELQKETVEQRVKKIKDLAERGEIVDSEGRTLALSLNAKNIAVYPNLIQKNETRAELAKLLSEVLEVPYKETLAKIKSKNSKGEYVQWTSIASRVVPEKAETLKNSKFSSFIEISNAPKRYYPNGQLASTLLGFVNYNSVAGAGIEMSLNHYLAGVNGYTIAELDSSKNEIPIGFQTASEALPGSQVTLTIDSYAQYALEETLKNAAEEMDPEGIHAVVMEPNTGKIVAMASYPSYDPNEYTTAEQSAINENASSYVYEPGSTFKPIYVAAALDGGYIDENFTYNDAGSINVNGTRIKNWDGINKGQLTLEKLLINSSNVGMINISRTMTSEQTVEALKKSGIGQKTGIELPNEEIGLIPSAKTLTNDPLVKATVSFGQGISITPLQLITSFSEVINGGYNVTPTIVEKVEDLHGNVQYQWEQNERKRVYSEKTSNLVKGYLKATMDTDGGKKIMIDGYDGGGKTGSAWKVEGNTYKPGAIIGSFIGFVPFDNPKYIMLAVVDEPKNSEFGSTSGGPVFHEAMTEILRYKGTPKTIPIEGEESVEKETVIQLPDVTYEVFDVAKDKIEKAVEGQVEVIKEGNGEVVVEQKYSYKNGVLIVSLKTVYIKGEGNEIYIPNVVGLPKEEVDQLFKKYNINTTSYGSGNVTIQETEPGVYIKKIKKIKLWSE